MEPIISPIAAWISSSPEGIDSASPQAFIMPEMNSKISWERVDVTLRIANCEALHHNLFRERSGFIRVLHAEGGVAVMSI